MAVSPIQEQHLPSVGAFLHEHLARRISPQAWVDSLTHRWADSQPNFGMQLVVDGRMVGALCAVYSDQWIDGKLERFCNPHSWCVLEEHRHGSINLVLGLLRQRGYHFTMYTPNPKVTQVFLGLRFRVLDERLLIFPNLPSLWPGPRDGFVEARLGHIADRLQGAALREFEAHRGIPWLQFVAFGTPAEPCLAIYKRSSWKRMSCALLMHVSDPSAMQRHGHLLRRHLSGHCGIAVTRVEARFLVDAPPFSYRAQRTQPKLVLSANLDDSKIRDVYSELMVLDI